MYGLTRATTTLIAAGVAGLLIWIATQVNDKTVGGFWAVYGLIAGGWSIPDFANRGSRYRMTEETLWAEHIEHEFRTRSTEKTLATMVEDAYVNHVPVLTGGVGREQLREFYSITSFRRCRPIPPSRLFPARSVTIRSSTK